MKYELKHYTFGQIIGKGFSLYIDNLVILLVLSFILAIPSTYLEYMKTTMGTPDPSNMTAFVILLGGKVVLSVLLTLLLTGLIIVLVSDKYLGNEFLFKNALNKSIKIVFPLLGLIFLMIIIYVIPATLIALLALIHWGLVVLFAIPYLVFGIMLSIGWIVAPHALIIERCSIIKALSRSWRLTYGEKGWIFGMLILVGLIGAAISIPFVIAIGVMASKQTNMTAMFVVQHVATAIVSPISACIYVVIYFNLRIKKEAFNVEHMAQQFEKASEGLSEDIV